MADNQDFDSSQAEISVPDSDAQELLDASEGQGAGKLVGAGLLGLVIALIIIFLRKGSSEA